MNGIDWNEWDDSDEWEFLLGCLHEDASAELADSSGSSSTAGDNVDCSTSTITNGPAIVQGVK